MTLPNRNIVNPYAGAADIPPAEPVSRRPGLIAAIIATIANWVERRAEQRVRRPRRPGRAPPVPDSLRADVGLPPLPQRLPDWWDRLPIPPDRERM